MKTILLNLAVAATAMILTFASCQRPVDVDAKTIYGRRAIDLMAEGERYEQAKNYRMALERYNRAVELSPRPALYYHIGACHYALGEYSKAQEYLKTALRLAGDYPAAQYLLSKVRIQLALAARRGTPAARATAMVSGTPTVPTRTPVKTETASATPRRTRPAPTVSRRTPIATSRTRPPTPQATRIRTPVRTAPVEVTRPGPTRPPRPPSTPVLPAPVTPTRTRPRPTRTPGLTPGVPVVPVTPPSSVEPISRNTGENPGPLPPIDPRKVFQKPTVITELESSTGTTSNVPLLGQWQYHWSNAKSFMKRELYEEAVDELLRCTAIRKNHLDSWLMLGDAYDKVGRGEKALKAYEYGRVLAPNNPKPYFRTGNYYLRHAMKGEGSILYNDALHYYNLALRVDPKYYEAYHNAAIVYMQLKDFENAKKAFLKALQIKPDYAKAHRNLGLLYDMYLKDYDAARRHYKEALRLGVDDPDVVREYLNALP